MEVVSSETAAVWRERIEKQISSGQSIRAWCLTNGLHEHSFYWWRSRLGLSPRPARVRRAKHQPVFAQVVIDQTNAREAGTKPPSIIEPPVENIVEPPAASTILLRLLGGRELVLPASMSDQRIAALVGLIEGRP